MPETVYCGKCEKEFTCNRNSDKCWCVELIIDENNLNYISNTYEGCLCSDCLSGFSIQE
ncbi:MAG: cysteine-rich CWC family protein [Candidatus Hodarchaeales archaeon]|jgi:hypothetical protein